MRWHKVALLKNSRTMKLWNSEQLLNKPRKAPENQLEPDYNQFIPNYIGSSALITCYPRASITWLVMLMKLSKIWFKMSLRITRDKSTRTDIIRYKLAIIRFQLVFRWFFRLVQKLFRNSSEFQSFFVRFCSWVLQESHFMSSYRSTKPHQEIIYLGQCHTRDTTFDTVLPPCHR